MYSNRRLCSIVQKLSGTSVLRPRLNLPEASSTSLHSVGHACPHQSLRSFWPGNTTWKHVAPWSHLQHNIYQCTQSWCHQEFQLEESASFEEPRGICQFRSKSLLLKNPPLKSIYKLHLKDDLSFLFVCLKSATKIELVPGT